MSAKRKTPYTVCRFCRKPVRLKPSGGDWLNALYTVRHDSKPGVRCEGMFHEIETKDIKEDR